MSTYYNINPLLKHAEKLKSPTIIIVGGKGNGKTYSVIEHYMEVYFKTGRMIRYLRRYRESITPKALQSLLLPHKKNIAVLSGGKYNSYKYYRNRFYFTRVNAKGDVTAKDNNPFIITSSLNSVESFTGTDEGECSCIFFDEFLSREKELPNEFQSMLIFHNNCTRNRTGYYCPLILVGNTMTRNSTLANDLGVNLYKLKQGIITDVYNPKNEILCVCEYCESTEKMQLSSEKIYDRYNSNIGKMITQGDWSVGNYPRILNKYLDNSDKVCTCVMTANETLYIDLRLYKSQLYGYVRTYKEKDDEIMFTITKNALLPSYDIIDTYDTRVPFLNTLKNLIMDNHVYFENGYTGEMFRDYSSKLKGGYFVYSQYR